jgi:hypothetical protein
MFTDLTQRAVATQRNSASAAVTANAQLSLLEDQEMDSITPGMFFVSKYDQIEKTIAFDPRWLDANDYFEFAQHDPQLSAQLPAGAMAKCIDDYGRMVIFIGTQWGVVIVFQRYEGRGDDIVAQLPAKLAKHRFKFFGYLSTEELRVLLGNGNNLNIGL